MGKKEEKKEHFSILSENVHLGTKIFGGGQCLNKHGLPPKETSPKNHYKSSAEYTPNCSCSYRWQGKFSENNIPSIFCKDRPELLKRMRTILNFKPPASTSEGSRSEFKKASATFKQAISGVTGIDVGKKNKAGFFYPAGYGRTLNLPREGLKGDWYPKGPDEPGYINVPIKNVAREKKKQRLINDKNRTPAEKKAIFDKLVSGEINLDAIPVGQNFTSQSWPYWNNHHHLISAGLFKKEIGVIAQKQDISFQTFADWLGSSPFNIHYRENMLILPMDTTISFLLGLPRHIRFELIIIDDTGNVCSRTQASHPQYDKYIKSKITPVLKEAASAFKKGEGHPSAIQVNEKISEKLYNISKSTSDELIKFGSASTIPTTTDHMLNKSQK